MSMFYVSHIGHRWASCPVGFSSRERAIAEARRSCREAMVTNVHDCSETPSGKLILSLSRWGEELSPEERP
jgi:hypothetical protein